MQKLKIPTCPAGRKNQNLRFYIITLHFTLYTLHLIGCATVPLTLPPRPEGIPGVYHRVEKRETLWRISQIYGVNLDDLAKINHLQDRNRIEVGQLIFIPHHQRQISLTSKFKFISEDFIWPVKGKTISSFGQITNNMINKGVDIQPYGIQDIVASRSGKVVFYADDFKDFGKTIIIDHGDNFFTVYTKIQEVFVKVNVEVRQGTVIAKTGSKEGDKNTYLHFEIRKGHVAQNPYFYLP